MASNPDPYHDVDSIAAATATATTATAIARTILSKCESGAAAQDILPRLQQLTALLQDPHDFLHEFASSQWEKAALSSVLDSGVLEQLSTTQSTSLEKLSCASGLPADKLSRCLRLLACHNVVSEPEPGCFSLTAISNVLATEPKFRAWIGFELFETCVASAYLAKSLKSKPNEYGTNVSAFHHAFGSEMYDWHSNNATEGKRFALAMQGVSSSLDPADELFAVWFSSQPSRDDGHVVEIGGRYGFASFQLAKRFPQYTYEVIAPSAIINVCQTAPDAEDRDKITLSPQEGYTERLTSENHSAIVAFVVRNVLWNWSDQHVISLLRSMLPTLRSSSNTRILLCDGVSPEINVFPKHIELAYRRRDITMMTMHNVKQRTQQEWLALFEEACPDFKISSESQGSSHVLKNLWELRVDA